MKKKSITTCIYLGSTPGSTTILLNGNSANNLTVVTVELPLESNGLPYIYPSAVN